MCGLRSTLIITFLRLIETPPKKKQRGYSSMADPPTSLGNKGQTLKRKQIPFHPTTLFDPAPLAAPLLSHLRRHQTCTRKLPWCLVCCLATTTQNTGKPRSSQLSIRPTMLGWHLCRTKLPRKVLNSKMKCDTKSLDGGNSALVIGFKTVLVETIVEAWKTHFSRHSKASKIASTKARLQKHDFPVHGKARNRPQNVHQTCLQSPKTFSPALFTVWHPQFQTQFQAQSFYNEYLQAWPHSQDEKVIDLLFLCRFPFVPTAFCSTLMFEHV